MYSFILIMMLLMPEPYVLFNFTPETNSSQWQVINDGVMGGVSKGAVTIDSKGHGVFHGKVSMENNGGFSSMRMQTSVQEIQGYSKVALHIKGDGHRYQFRVKSAALERHSYIHYFNTTGDWEIIELPLNEFYASFRGQKLDIANFSANTLGQIGFLIGNKKAQEFSLTIDKIVLK